MPIEPRAIARLSGGAAICSVIFIERFAKTLQFENQRFALRPHAVILRCIVPARLRIIESAGVLDGPHDQTLPATAAVRRTALVFGGGGGDCCATAGA
jgi:hypothetical protein